MGVKDHCALANIKTVLQQAVLIEQCCSEGSSIGERDVAASKIAQAMDVTLAGGDDDAADAVGFSGVRDNRVSEVFSEQHLIRVDDGEIEDPGAQFGIVGIGRLSRFHFQGKSDAGVIQSVDEL